ncbi:DinB family protein [Zhouia amylolytica]|uniref:DinB-like domain-containing protein n=1 Tax=Zhouia amylolytica AD3 TaxID=1286632 RepID=W2UUI2_9FLAO|nr:DinB family protein [Zhouia amylolytica]ETN97022.1 hypothetical protein P278_04480 [Zhouia amylolytica AD3]
MKSFCSILFVCAFVFNLSLYSQNTLSEKDRAFAIKHLNESKAELLKAIKGLSEEQLNFKPSENSWSIANCVEHLALSENNIMGAVKKSLEEKPSTESLNELKTSDKELIDMITDRSSKVKTSKPFEPTNSFGSYEETLKAFKDRRKNNITFVKKDKINLRNYVMDLPFGKIDAFQGILFMSGHTSRHVKQINEIKSNESFPE